MYVRKKSNKCAYKFVDNFKKKVLFRFIGNSMHLIYIILYTTYISFLMNLKKSFFLLNSDRSKEFFYKSFITRDGRSINFGYF
jgi:hypothetical protein